MKKADLEYELSPEEQEREELLREKRQRKKKRARILDRIAGFIIVSCIIGGCAALGLLYVILEGPSPTLRDTFVNTMDETRRFRFVPAIFLGTEELEAIRSTGELDTSIVTDTSLINIGGDGETGDGSKTLTEMGLVDDDGDGIIFDEVHGNGFTGYMIIVLDPTRVFVGMPDVYGGSGMTLEQFCDKYDALGGINAGGYVDDNGAGTGGFPQGLTIVDGHCYNDEFGVTDGSAGFDSNGILHVGYFTYEEAVAMDIVNCVSFGPILITNGTITPDEYLQSGINPRTAIGQRADGAVLMLAIDGRQVHSSGATYKDVAEVMLDYGAVNACNMDGGSSTAMYYDGEYRNSPSSGNGQCRALPNAFLFK